MKSNKTAGILGFTLIVSLLSPNFLMANGQSKSLTYDSLQAGETVSGFTTVAVYLNDEGRRIGARFKHIKTGFIFDALQIQSVPQGFIWVNSFPVSDRGEPHTQEHLLVAKGNKGRGIQTLENMSLVNSNAFTEQLRTAYDFNTAAGPAECFRITEAELDALLHPDYTDEEIRREVRNFGVSENPADKTLRLEEKGTVYNEMVSSFDQPGSELFRQLSLLAYGAHHPLSYESGGLPEGIRQMKSEDIRRFHDANYHLGNMGMIGSYPKEMKLDEILSRMNEMLSRLEPNPPQTKFASLDDLPVPSPAPRGEIRIVDYPNKNAQQPGLVVLEWPANRELDSSEEALLQLFLDNISGDPTTNLYKIFVDTKTRKIDTGAKAVFSFLNESEGYPTFIGLVDVAPSHMNNDELAQVRQIVINEINRVASLKPGSPELVEFNSRIKNRVLEFRRGISKFVNTPPGFGDRNTGSEWISHLIRLNKSQTFEKSVTLKPEIESVEKLLGRSDNFWTEYLAKWKLSNSIPFIAAAKPNPQLIETEQRERVQRSDVEVERLKAKYGITDNQEAIRRYRTEYDEETASLDALARKDESAHFIDSPPMTLDDQLEYKVSKLSSGVPVVASTFDSMTSSTAGLALRLDSVPDDDVMYLSMLPALLTKVGVIKKGVPVTFEEMSELLRKEILNLNASYVTNSRTGRAELVVRGAGNDAGETARAIEWMNLVLSHPNWRKDNLARIRDVVDQTLSGLRNTEQQAEENWVSNPANAYRRQDSKIYLSISSFLTQIHNVQRLRWMLKDAGNPDEARSSSAFLLKLAEVAGGQSRDDLLQLLAAMQGQAKAGETLSPPLKEILGDFQKLPTASRTIAINAEEDLAQTLGGIPDSTLAADWAYLCKEMEADLRVTPESTLASLDRIRQLLLNSTAARMFLIGSAKSQQAIGRPLGELALSLNSKRPAPVSHSMDRVIDLRLRERFPGGDRPVFVGLMNPNSQSGVFLNSAPGVSYSNTDRESLLNYLSFKLYGGGGAHSIFTKTIGAGLAYSNGLSNSATSARMTYYAERTPELPQTLSFVINELKNGKEDPSLVEYAIALAFSEYRSNQAYESRGESMAADIADGLTPESVRKFRQTILDLRRTPNLAHELFDRMNSQYGRVLPGLSIRSADVPGGIYFVIGNEKQFISYEAYLRSVEGAGTQLYRLYPRDFWIVRPEAAQKQ